MITNEELKPQRIQNIKGYVGNYFVNTDPAPIEEVTVENVGKKIRVVVSYVPRDYLSTIPAKPDQCLQQVYEGTLDDNMLTWGRSRVSFMTWRTKNKAGAPSNISGLIIEDGGIWFEPLFIRRF
jgi:hypothetical protein